MKKSSMRWKSENNKNYFFVIYFCISSNLGYTQYPAAGEEQAAEHPLLSMTVNRLRQSSGSSPLPSSESSPLSASFVSMSNSRERISQNIRL